MEHAGSLQKALRDDEEDDFEEDYEMEAREAMGREWSSSERLPVRGIDGRLRSSEQLVAAKDRAKSLASGESIRPYSLLSAKAGADTNDESEDGSSGTDSGIDDSIGQAQSKGSARGRVTDRADTEEPNEQMQQAGPSWRSQTPAERAQRRATARLRIAGLCDALVSDPESAVMPPKPAPPLLDANGEPQKRKRKKAKSPLAELQALSTAVDPVVRNLALASQLAVLQDILPGYRVRLPTAAEIEEQKLSKEVRQTWTFERALLDAYETYLHGLGACIELHPSGKGRLRRDAALVFPGANRLTYGMQAGDKALRSVASTAAKCLCELLQSHQHFNHSELVVRSAVALADCGDDELEAIAHSALKEMFAMDPTGYASSEAAEAISKRVKKRGPRVSMGLLGTMSHMRIRRLISDDKDLRKKKKHADGDDPKAPRKPDTDEVEIALKAMDADERVLRQKANERALKAAVTALFRLLKHPKGTAVLGPVLQALGRFVHLIDVDVAADVLAAMENITDRSTLPAANEASTNGPGGPSAFGGADGDDDSDAEHGHHGDSGSSKPLAFAAGASEESMLDDRSGAVLNEDELAVVRDGAGATQVRVRRKSKQTRAKRREKVLLNEQVMGHLPIPITINPEVAFELVGAASWIIAGPGQSLDFDGATFSTFLYRAMLAVPMGGRKATDACCRAVSLQMLRRREPDAQIAAAFAKRCLALSLSVDSRCSAALLQQFRQIVGAYTDVEQILDRVQDRVQGGTYQIDGVSLEKCAGLAAPTFELADLALRSWHPKMREFARKAITKAVVSPAEAPAEILKGPAFAVPDDSCGFASLPPAASRDAAFADLLGRASALAGEQSGLSALDDALSFFESRPSGLETLSATTQDSVDRLCASGPSALFPGEAGRASSVEAATAPAYAPSAEYEMDCMAALEASVLGESTGPTQGSAPGSSKTGRHLPAQLLRSTAGTESETAVVPQAVRDGGQGTVLGKRAREQGQGRRSELMGTTRESKGTSSSSVSESQDTGRAGSSNPKKQSKSKQVLGRASSSLQAQAQSGPSSKSIRERGRKKRKVDRARAAAVVQPASLEAYKAKLLEKYNRQKFKWTKGMNGQGQDQSRDGSIGKGQRQQHKGSKSMGSVMAKASGTIGGSDANTGRGGAGSSLVAPAVGGVARSALTSDPGKPRRRKASKQERLQERIETMRKGRAAMRFD